MFFWHTELATKRSNFCKDHRDKTVAPDPLVVEDLISDKLSLSNTLKKEGRAFRNIEKHIAIPCLFCLFVFFKLTGAWRG